MINELIEVRDDLTLYIDYKVSKHGLYNVKIKPVTNIRSYQQNRYYWAVVVPHIVRFFESFGKHCSSEEAHTQFKDMVGWYKDEYVLNFTETKIQGFKVFTERRVYRSFSNAGDISTAEFSNALDIVRTAVLEYSNGEIDIPLPWVAGYDFMNKKDFNN